jgi:DNA-binding MarR family transcriptional regulator
VTNRTGAERSISFLLARAGFESARRLRERLAPFGVDTRQFAVLHEVALEPGRSQQALAERTGVPKSGMVALLDDLEKRGLVERRRSDRRTHALHLTRAGADLLRRSAATAMAHDDELAEPLTAAERRQLVALLAKLAGQHTG